MSSCYLEKESVIQKQNHHQAPSPAVVSAEANSACGEGKRDAYPVAVYSHCAPLRHRAGSPATRFDRTPQVPAATSKRSAVTA